MGAWYSTPSHGGTDPLPTPPAAATAQGQESGLFMGWDSFVVMLPFLPTVESVRLLSKAHRSAVDGFLLVERGKVPLYPRLGFQMDRFLDEEDVYTLFRFGEKAWKANRSIGRDEYRLASTSLRTQLRMRAEAWNKMKEVDLDVDQLHSIPYSFMPNKKLDACDIYVLRKYGVKAWRVGPWYKYYDEMKWLCARAHDRLKEEAKKFNDYHTIKEIPRYNLPLVRWMAQAPPLPEGFNPGCNLEAYDVYVIRKHGAHNFNTPKSSSWWGADGKHAKPQWKGEYNRVSDDLLLEITAQSLASKYTITTEGVVQQRGPPPKKQRID